MPWFGKQNLLAARKKNKNCNFRHEEKTGTTIYRRHIGRLVLSVEFCVPYLVAPSSIISGDDRNHYVFRSLLPA